MTENSSSATYGVKCSHMHDSCNMAKAWIDCVNIVTMCLHIAHMAHQWPDAA